MEIQGELIYFIFYFSSKNFPFFSKSNNLRGTVSHSSSLEWRNFEHWADTKNYLLVKVGKQHLPWKVLERV